jgi:hypothetical protein
MILHEVNRPAGLGFPGGPLMDNGGIQAAAAVPPARSR